MDLKILGLLFVTICSLTTFAATDAEIATWTNQAMIAKAKTIAVKPGQAKIVSVMAAMVNGGERKRSGVQYWDVTCYSFDGEKNHKETCTSYPMTFIGIGESGFGRIAMNSCYVGNVENVCEAITRDVPRGDSGDHGSFGNVRCAINSGVVAVQYTATNDYKGSSESEMTIAPCF